MEPQKLKSASKFLSFVLRHHPEEIGISLDSSGWANIADLIALTQNRKQPLTEELILEIVATNDKQRFALSSDGLRIRASQGHSVAIDLQLLPQTPPDILYHGTATRFLESIQQQGLLPGTRQHVHLSADQNIALQVGQRHGKPFVLTVNALKMHESGCEFYRSDNGVWLVAAVPAEFIAFPELSPHP
jgi:putative RNA 2'-phosphotransferase